MNEKELLELIKENKRLICKIIGKYTKYYDFDDLYQVSIIGIIKAYNNYNPNSNAKFSTYAYKYILSEVISYVNNSKTIKTSKEYNRLYKKILEAKNILTQKLMKEPTTRELSLFLELDENLLNEVLTLKESVKSLDEAINEDGRTLTLLDSIGTEDINIDSINLRDSIKNLSEEEQELIKLRYFQDKTQSETAQYLQTNQVQVSRNEAKILQKLKKSIC